MSSLEQALNLDEEQRWLVDRYVLGDDTLDRDEFESRMLEEPRLALAVADAVQTVQTISAACVLDSSSLTLEQAACGVSRVQVNHRADRTMGSPALLSFSSAAERKQVQPAGHAPSGISMKKGLSLATIAVLLLMASISVYQRGRLAPMVSNAETLSTAPIASSGFASAGYAESAYAELGLLSAVAENWIAFSSAGDTNGLRLQETGLTVDDALNRIDGAWSESADWQGEPNEGNAEGEDWMLEAASDFYYEVGT